MRIYFAAPLFNQAERAYNLYLTGELERRGFSVFLPQRDGIGGRAAPDRELSDEEFYRAVFELDRDQVLEAEVLLFVLDGRVPDEGACVELGLAYAQKHLLNREKLIIGLLTDRRAALLGRRLNPMIDGTLDWLVESERELMAALEQYRSETS